MTLNLLHCAVKRERMTNLPDFLVNLLKALEESNSNADDNLLLGFLDGFRVAFLL